MLVVINVGVLIVNALYYEKRLDEALNTYQVLRKELVSDGTLTFEDVYKKKDRLGDIEKRFLPERDFSKLVSYLFEQAMGSKVEITNVGYNFEEKKGLPLIKVTLSINVEGSYEDLRRFIYRLESSAILFQVSSVKITRAQQNVIASLTLITFLKAS